MTSLRVFCCVLMCVESGETEYMTSAETTRLLGVDRVDSAPKVKAAAGNGMMTTLRQRFAGHLLNKDDITEGLHASGVAIYTV